MQRTSNDTMNSAHLRATLRTWLDNAGKRPVWLAQEAGLNPSILSRFLNQKTQLDQVSALKLYRALKHRMTRAEQQDYLETAGLQGLIHDIAEPPAVDVLPPRQLGGPHDLLLAGMAYLNAANQAIQRQSVKDATPLLSAAEKAFGPTSTNAAYAACRIGINLSILGDVDGAVNELTRAGTTYADIMDISTRVYYYTARGYVEFDRANPDTAYRWCRQAIETAQRAGAPELAEDSVTYMALIPIEIARSAPDTPGLSTQLAEADVWIDVLLERYGFTDAQTGHYHFFRSQLRQAQGRREDAYSERRIVRHYSAGRSDTGRHHYDIDEAELALLDMGGTATARRRAIASIEGWMTTNYSGGIARATRVLATAALQDSNVKLAFELALAAACINPFGTLQDRVKLDMVLRAAREAVQRELLPRDYTRLIENLRVKAETQQGAFRPLSAVVPSRKTDLDAIFGRAMR